MIATSNSYVGDRAFPSGDLQQIWKAVVSRLGSVSKALFHAHGTLCFLNDRGALVSIKTEPLLKLALGKLLELETAFREVCGRPIPVNLTIAPSSPMPLVTSSPIIVAPETPILPIKPALKPRDNTYVHPSWLAKALAGDRQCLYSLHTQANFVIPKKDSDFDAAAYKIKHQGLVEKSAQDLRTQGYTVHTENANSFKVTLTGGGVISGTPDIVAIRDSEVLVIDVKTGQCRVSNQAQVLLYMFLIPLVGLHGISQVPAGQLVYQHYPSVEIPVSDLTEEFKQRTKHLVTMMRLAEVPHPIPSVNECRYCPMGDCCADRVSQEAEVELDW